MIPAVMLSDEAILEELESINADLESRKRIRELKRAQQAKATPGLLPAFPMEVNDPEPSHGSTQVREPDMEAPLKVELEARGDTTLNNCDDSEPPPETAQDHFEAPTPNQDPKGSQKLTRHGESSTQPKKQKTMPTFLIPVNNHPAYSTVVRSANGTYYELSCYICKGNASAFMGSAIKPQFLQGSRGLQRHICQTHADLTETLFTEKDVIEKCISRKLTSKEAKAVDKGTYRVSAIRTAKASVRRARVTKSKRAATNGDTDQMMASRKERQSSKVPTKELSPGFRARSTALGGPGNPSGFFSTDNALPTTDSESGY